jgi:urease accessory protein
VRNGRDGGSRRIAVPARRPGRPSPGGPVNTSNAPWGAKRLPGSFAAWQASARRAVFVARLPRSTHLADRRSIDALSLAPAPAPPSASPGPQRARGELRLAFEAKSGGARLIEAYQSGCLHARLPRVHAGESPCAVLINTGGGVTGGDRLTQSIRWGAGACAAVATQAAEKIYRSTGEDADISTRIAVAAGAHAEWLPQEAILFDRARLSRRMEVDLDEGADFLGVEAVILGRSAMGETVREAALRDSWRIRRGGRLVYADIQKLDGPVDRLMDRAALGAGARAMAVIVHASTRAAALLEAVRGALEGAAGRAAASSWNGLLVARFLAPDGQTLRHDLIPALAALRGGRALPRVWSC